MPFEPESFETASFELDVIVCVGFEGIASDNASHDVVTSGHEVLEVVRRHHRRRDGYVQGSMNGPNVTTTFQRAAGAVSAEVDGQTVLVSPADLRYFGLNRTSSAIWDALPASDAAGVGVDDVVEAMLARFDVEHERARAEVTAHLDKMVAAGLVIVGKTSTATAE